MKERFFGQSYFHYRVVLQTFGLVVYLLSLGLIFVHREPSLKAFVAFAVDEKSE